MQTLSLSGSLFFLYIFAFPLFGFRLRKNFQDENHDTHNGWTLHIISVRNFFRAADSIIKIFEDGLLWAESEFHRNGPGQKTIWELKEKKRRNLTKLLVTEFYWPKKTWNRRRIILFYMIFFVCYTWRRIYLYQHLPHDFLPCIQVNLPFLRLREIFFLSLS